MEGLRKEVSENNHSKMEDGKSNPSLEKSVKDAVESTNQCSEEIPDVEDVSTKIADLSLQNESNKCQTSSRSNAMDKVYPASRSEKSDVNNGEKGKSGDSDVREMCGIPYWSTEKLDSIPAMQARGPTDGVPTQRYKDNPFNAGQPHFQHPNRDFDRPEQPAKYKRVQKGPVEHEESGSASSPPHHTQPYLQEPFATNPFPGMTHTHQPHEATSPISDFNKPSIPGADTSLMKIQNMIQSQIGEIPDIIPSIQKFDSDEIRQLADDLIQGAAEIKKEEIDTAYSPEMAGNNVADNALSPDMSRSVNGSVSEMTSPYPSPLSDLDDVSQQSTINAIVNNFGSPGSAVSDPASQKSDFQNMCASINQKLDSDEIRKAIEGLDDIDPEEGKNLSVTDLIAGNTTGNNDYHTDASPASTNISSPASNMSVSNSPYSAVVSPGSDESSQSSTVSYANNQPSKPNITSQNLTDMLPKPTFTTCTALPQSDHQQVSGGKPGAPTAGNKTNSKPKSAKKSTGRPRGRPPKSKTNDKSKQTPSKLIPIVPKPNPGTGMIPTTVIILPSNFPNVGPPMVSSGNTSVMPPTVRQPRPCDKAGAVVPPLQSQLPPRTFTKEILPSEKDKNNLRKSERIVAGIDRQKLLYTDSVGDTLLHQFSLLNYEELIDFLFDNSQSLLTIGVGKDRYMFRALVERMDRDNLLPEVINKRNNHNQTPLYLAVSTNKPELVKLLIDKGADPNIFANTRTGFRMPLHVAAEKGKEWIPILRILLQAKGIKIDATNSERKTPLHCAVEAHRPPQIDSFETVKILMQHKAKILKGPNDHTALHTLVERTDSKFFRFLVNLIPEAERKDILNMKDSIGNTCLHLCTVRTKDKDGSGKHNPAVKEIMDFLLLVCEVDISIANQKNETAKKLLCRDNKPVCISFKEAENRRRNSKLRIKAQQEEMMRAQRRDMANKSNIFHTNGANIPLRHPDPQNMSSMGGGQFGPFSDNSGTQWQNHPQDMTKDSLGSMPWHIPEGHQMARSDGFFNPETSMSDCLQNNLNISPCDYSKTRNRPDCLQNDCNISQSGFTSGSCNAVNQNACYNMGSKRNDVPPPFMQFNEGGFGRDESMFPSSSMPNMTSAQTACTQNDFSHFQQTQGPLSYQGSVPVTFPAMPESSMHDVMQPIPQPRISSAQSTIPHSTVPQNNMLPSTANGSMHNMCMTSVPHSNGNLPHTVANLNSSNISAANRQGFPPTDTRRNMHQANLLHADVPDVTLADLQKMADMQVPAFTGGTLDSHLAGLHHNGLPHAVTTNSQM